MNETNNQARKVGWSLGLGVAFLPLFFGWLVFRKGYGPLVRWIARPYAVLGSLIMFMVILGAMLGPTPKRTNAVAAQPNTPVAENPAQPVQAKPVKLSDYASKCRLQNEFGFSIGLGDTKVSDEFSEAQICKMADVAINSQIRIYRSVCEDLVIKAVKDTLQNQSASVGEINQKIDILIRGAEKQGNGAAVEFFTACKIGNDEKFLMHAGGQYSKFQWKVYSVGNVTVGGVKKPAYLLESSKAGYRKYFLYSYDSGEFAVELMQKGVLDPKQPNKGGETPGYIYRSRYGYTGDLPEYYEMDGVQYPYGESREASKAQPQPPIEVQNSARGDDSGRKLYQYYKSFSGNKDKPGQWEEEFVDGKILSTCKVAGKYDAYFGWVTMRSLFVAGAAVKDDSPKEPLYVFVVDMNGAIKGLWRGKQYMSAIKNYAENQGCNI